MAEKKASSKLLMYKDKPLVRVGDNLFYGNPDDKFIVSFILSDYKTVGDAEIAGKVIIQLQQNDSYLNIKNKPIKKATRENLWSALDVGEYWLKDALSYVN